MSNLNTVLVTGGAGYIGSHTCVELVQSGYEVVVIDNLSNSSSVSLERVKNITGKDITFYEMDLRDGRRIDTVLLRHNISSVIHFAGFKAVGESRIKPLEYYENNVVGSVALARSLRNHNINNIIFSSSATVYGNPASVPIKEDFPTCATNPYGQSKLIVENIFRDLCNQPESNWNITILRYFNPIGAHESGSIGEFPHGIPNNLLPFVSQVAIGVLPHLKVFGDDYETRDGTGVRDYIHVVDLAKAHVAALQHQLANLPGCKIYNIGTGTGYSVNEIIQTFEAITGRQIAYKIVARRPGDIAECFADTSLAASELNWKSEYDLERMIEDQWRWQIKNPSGYAI